MRLEVPVCETVKLHCPNCGALEEYDRDRLAFRFLVCRSCDVGLWFEPEIVTPVSFFGGLHAYSDYQ